MFGSKSTDAHDRPRALHFPDLRRGAGALDIVWCLRHLRGLREIDWSDDRLDYRLIAILDRAFAGLHDYYFRMEVRGWEHVPAGPGVLVGNHSGFGVAELLMLLVAWHRHFGSTRPVQALAHRWLYKTRFLGTAVGKIGGVPATWRNAGRVLGAGRRLAVFPGGEKESTRPFSERYRVALHGHKGFVRLALEHDVPLVPMVTIGSHATMILPPGMHALATLTGARRFLGLEAVPVPLQIVVWILAGIALDENVISTPLFLMLLAATPPLYPSKITTVFGPSIPPAMLRRVPRDAGEDVVEAAYRYVEELMQRTMSGLAAERRSLFG